MATRRWGFGVAASVCVVAAGMLAPAAMARAPAAPPGAPAWVGGAGGVYYRSIVVVLTWHNVAPSGAGDTIPTAAFAAQMAELRADGFHAIPPAALAGFLANRRAVPDNAVLLTFDNGDLGVYKYAFPILRRFRYPVLLFPIFGRIGVNRPFLTPSDLKALVASGLVTLGSHTFQEHNGIGTGPDTSEPADIGRKWNGSTQETLAQYVHRVGSDAGRAKAAIARYAGRSEPYFSDPFGQYTPLLERILARYGFTEDFTTLGWGVVPGAPPNRLPRINVGTAQGTASSMVGAILDIARLTAAAPGWHPPIRYTTVWR